MAMLDLYTSRMEQESEEALEAVPLGAFAVRRGITMGLGATDLGIAKARSHVPHRPWVCGWPPRPHPLGG